MTESEDFECVFNKEVDDKTWRRIVRIISSIRAEIRKKSRCSSRRTTY
jgi:hypothetical protein